MSRRKTVLVLALALALTLVWAAGLTACGGGTDGGDSSGGSGGSGAATPSESAYTPPFSQPGEDGWETSPPAAMVDAPKAEWLNPVPDSPEAAVVKFLASRVRGDDAWQGAMVSSPSDRAKRSLDEWADWELTRFQLRGKKETGPDAYYVRTYFEIAVEGDTDEGEDEFEVVREGGGWRVAGVPS
jgi:hypothetical protein